MSEKELAINGLKDAQEDFKVTKKRLNDWFEEWKKEGKPFSNDPDYLKLEEQVEKCRQREERFLKAVYPNTGNLV